MRGLLSSLGEEFDERESRAVLAKRCKDTYLDHIKDKEMLGGESSTVLTILEIYNTYF